VTVARLRLPILAAVLIVPLLTVFAGAQPATAPAAKRPSQQAAVVELSGTIDNFSRDSLVRRFDRARQIGADTVIVEINTYGGLASAGLDISRFLKRQDDLHTIALVNDNALSAGAMIALACDEIVMAPGAQLGDCAPIAMTARGEIETLGSAERAKAESPILADFYDSAVRNGYDPLLAQSMVSVGRVVHWMENSAGERRFVDAKGYEKLMAEGDWKPVSGLRDPIDTGEDLLTVNTDLAIRLGLASGTATSASQLARDRGLSLIATFAPTTAEYAVRLLTSTAARSVLVILFMLALYMAFAHPGHGLAEAASFVALALLVGMPLLTGHAQLWEILLIVIGLGLLCIEIFLIPGFGFTGVTGILLIIFGLVMTFVGDEPASIPGVMPALAGTWQAIFRGLVIVVVGLACSLLLWVWLQRYLPKLPYVNRLILSATAGGNATVIDTGIPGAIEVVAWPTVGAVGAAVTDLRPGGTAQFLDEGINESRTTDVVSDSGFVAKGAKVVVREVHGNRVVVRAA
jgi:membrane-bound serine protease (ClpP class)